MRTAPPATTVRRSQSLCYVLGDKLQASKFKTFIMDEILGHGLYCKSSNLTTGHIHYAYYNTIRNNDPLKRFSIMTKFELSPTEDNLVNPEFSTLMESRRLLMKDMVHACRKQALKQKQRIEICERGIRDCNERI